MNGEENEGVRGCISGFEVEGLSRMAGWEGDVGCGEPMVGPG